MPFFLGWLLGWNLPVSQILFNYLVCSTYNIFGKDLQKGVCEFLKKAPWPKFYSSKIDSR